MPKNTKKRKEKAADFTKAKLKLGKGKKAASNAVDISFKARSIVLPQQRITVTKNETAPTTRRGLTLDDLLSQLKHYSPNVRKDAIHGLNELLEGNAGLAETHLLKLLNACARLTGDEDALVRKALHSFLGWLLLRVARDALAPHISTLLVFISSAMTHIFPEIRIDAIKVLDLLLDYFPQQVVGGVLDVGANRSGQSQGRKLLDAYLNLLSVNSRLYEDDQQKAASSSASIGQTISMVSLSAASKTVILKSFAKFLAHATSSEILTEENAHDAPIPLWYMKSSFRSEEGYKTFVETLGISRSSRTSLAPRVWQCDAGSSKDTGFVLGQYPLCDTSNGVLQDIASLEQTASDILQICRSESAWQIRESSGSQLLSKLCQILHPVLISLILDCAPSVFAPTPSNSEAEQELLLAALEIARCLYGRLLRDGSLIKDQEVSAGQELMALLSHMTVYFPFGENRVIALDTKSHRAFEQMNLIYCELFSLRSLASSVQSDFFRINRGAAAPKRRKINHQDDQVPAAHANVDKQTRRVREHVIRSLRGQAAPGISGSNRPLGFSLTVQTYTALLPTLWWLLNQPDDASEDVSEVLLAVLEHATKSGSTSGVKAAATELVARIVLAQGESSYVGMLRIGSGGTGDRDLHDALHSWLLHLPKVLWEIGDKNAAASELIMLFLLRLTQHHPWIYTPETADALCTRLQPLFTMQHASRGELRGPYHKLNKTSGPEGPSAPALQDAKSAPASEIFPLRRLALDVAAALVSTSFLGPPSSALAFSNKSKNKNTPSRQRGMEGRSEFGSVPVSGPGFGSASGVRDGHTSSSVPVPGVDTDSASARAALRTAVNKAVEGTSEADYWRGILGALTPTS